jgi:predicted MFS family arabinose efflux permease
MTVTDRRPAAVRDEDLARVRLSRRTILLLALTCGVAVGNIYFPQAISPSVAAGLHIGAGSAALVVTATQFGYAAGIFLLVPLGDRLPH